MTEALAGVAGPASAWLLTYLLHSTVLLAAAWCLARAGWARSPVTLDVLWKLAAVAGVVSATLAVRGPDPGGAPAAEELLRWSASSATDAPTEPESAAGPAVVPRTIVLAEVRRVDVAPGASAAQEASAACRGALRRMEVGAGPSDPAALLEACGSRRVPWRGALVVVWLAGAALLLVREVRRALALRGVRRRATPAGPRGTAALARVGGPAGVDGGQVRGRRPRLVASMEVDAPCVLGAGTIALPARCEAHLADDELEAVVAHELAHVLRRDVAWRGALRALAALLWVQPLNRRAVAGAAEAAELACDDWALGRTRPLGLARSIFRVAEWALPAGRRPALVGVASGDGRTLSRRVRRILHDRPSGPASPGRTLVLAALLLAPAPFLPAVGAPATLFAVVFERTDDGAAPGASAAEAADPSGPGATAGAAVPVSVRRVIVRAREGTGSAEDHRIVVRARMEDRPSR